MSQSVKNKKKIDAYFKRNKKPKCFYCNQVVHKSHNERHLHPLTATIDHIHSRLDIRRFLISEKKNVVLSCHKCNDTRNELERIKISKDYSSYGNIYPVMTNVGLEIQPLNFRI